MLRESPGVLLIKNNGKVFSLCGFQQKITVKFNMQNNQITTLGVKVELSQKERLETLDVSMR